MHPTLAETKVTETVAKEQERRRFESWWSKLTTRAKRAVVCHQERRDLKAIRRAAPKQTTSGYQCPKCWRWHPTPEARKACRVSHHQEAAHG